MDDMAYIDMNRLFKNLHFQRMKLRVSKYSGRREKVLLQKLFSERCCKCNLWIELHVLQNMDENKNENQLLHSDQLRNYGITNFSKLVSQTI